jgi:gliding motility-associated-like protein
LKIIKTKNRLVFFLLGFLLTSSGLSSFAQKEAAVWLTGSGKQMNFQSGRPELLEFNGEVNPAASICDSEGNLLLYSDGRKIWNKYHEVIVNGDNLLNQNNWLGAYPFFLPYPGRDGWYIIVYEVGKSNPQPGFYNNALYYGEIDVNAQNGRGQLVTRDVRFHDNYHASPTIAGYCNNSYYWLGVNRNENIVHGIGRDRIYFYRIDENGLNNEPVINDKLDLGHSGMHQFSPNGDKMVFWGGGQADEGFFIADFNFKKGELYNYRRIDDNAFYNSAFSPDSRFLYFFKDQHLCQLDARFTDGSNLHKSFDTLLSLPVNDEYPINGWDLTLAPDKKIYFNYQDIVTDTRKLGRINLPNKNGEACGVELDVITIPLNFRFPHFMTGFFRDKQPEFIDEVFALAGEAQTLCPGLSEVLGKNTEENAFYHWYPEQYLNDPFTAQPVFTAPQRSVYAKTDIYTLRTTDGNCWIHFDEVSITQNPSPSAPSVYGSRSVCPFVEEVVYQTEPRSFEIQWLVDGGEIVSGQGTNQIEVNWWDTNFDASVGVFYVNSYGCSSDTTWFPVRINVELLTETPKGPEDLCIANRNNQVYQITNTNGSVYDWIAEGGEIVSGQGTNLVVINWLREGVHSLVVEETSTTIDTVCYGESEPLLVNVINDSLDIELENVSFNLQNNVDIIYHSEKLKPLQHVLYIVSEGEETGRTTEENLSGWINYTGSTMHFTNKGQLESETIRLRVQNSCDEILWSNPLQTIALKMVTVFGQQVRLAWNHNRFWDTDRVKYELWHAVNEPENWELAEKDLDEVRFDFLNSGMELTHFFRIKAINIDEDKVSWSNWVKAELEDVIEIPDVFTPNGDGINDVWEIRNIRFHELQHAIIYNRHGQKVFECRNEYIPWDGQQKGEIIQGTYFYELVFTDGNVKRGLVTVLQ